jgi:hypothetical protein
MSEWSAGGSRAGGPKPIMRNRSSVKISRPRRRWSGVSWWFSLLFAAGLVAWGATYLFDMRDDGVATTVSASTLMIAITDQDSGEPIANAQVRAGESTVLSDETGNAQLPAPNEPVMVAISRDGYQPVYGQADADTAPNQAVTLTASVAQDPAPQGEQPVVVQEVPQEELAEQSQEGTTAELSVTPTDTAQNAQTASGNGGDATGRVLAENGDPIWEAAILVNGSVTHSAEDGTFELVGVAPGTEVRVGAPGYADSFVSMPESGPLDVVMTRQDIKAAYLTGAKLNDRAKIEELIELTKTTELNAIVIDMKEGHVYYDTSVQFFHDAGAVNKFFNPAALVEEFKSHGIYTIARIVVFNDPVVARANPELAVRNVDGGIWLGYNDVAWVNPYRRELWQPNIDLAVEAANMGFDEIQYDYVRFPSDGDLSVAEFGEEFSYTEEERVGTIVEFLKVSKAALEPLGVKLAADVFGIISVYNQDQGIGQRLPDFAEVVDYVCPMVYPSHFNEGSIGVDGHPNAFPYETLDITIGIGVSMIPGRELKMRPWIQDFTWGEPPYGPEEVKAQIDATMKNGASGWMLWNASSTVTAGALAPESG